MDQQIAIRLLIAGDYLKWNQYRISNPKWIPDLMNINLIKANFRRFSFNMDRADLRNAILPPTSCFPDDPASINAKGKVKKPSRPTWLESITVSSKDSEVPTGSTFKDAVYSAETRLLDTEDMSILERLGAQKYEPDVFVSYAHVDKELVYDIKDYLEKEKGLNITIDVEIFSAGKSIRSEIINTMSEAEIVLSFYSTRAAGKPWIEFEHELARALEMEAKKKQRTPPRTIFIVLDNAELPDVIEKNRIALFIKGLIFEEAVEKIYAHVMQMPIRLNRDYEKRMGKRIK